MKFNASKKILIASTLLISFGACTDNNQCDTALAASGKNYTDSSYKAIVKKALEDFPKNKTKFYLDEYEKIGADEFLLLNIKQTPNTCLKAMFQVMPDVFIADIRKTQGLGYRGAELKGLQYESKLQADTLCFVITKIEEIED